MDFLSYINDRTKYFVGRDWVFKKVNDWTATNSKIFLLVGGPGTGKSAITARLVSASNGVTIDSVPTLIPGWLTYSHFCQAGFGDTVNPLLFVASLSEALANRYPKFRASLEKTASSQIVLRQDITNVAPGASVVGPRVGEIRIEIKNGDARPLFDQAVRLPLKELCDKQFTDSIFILVDSLDEALTFNPDSNITQLMKLVNDFPDQVRFIFTSRSSNRVFNLVGPPTLDLIVDAAGQPDEVELYARTRLNGVGEPQRTQLAQRIAKKSSGNFLYAFHVLNDVIAAGAIVDGDTIPLPDELDDVYRAFLKRELASNPQSWSDVYRPLLGPIAVALGEGLTREQLIGITDLAEDKTDDVLKICGQYLVGGEAEAQPYRIYHQSFREFLLTDKDYSVYPAERHEAIAKYFQKECGANWNRCGDAYGVRYTPAHWADSATTSKTRRDRRTESLVALTGSQSYQAAFETRVGDLPALQEYLHRAVKVAALNDRVDMLPWLIKAARQFGNFRENYLRGESVVALAVQGEIRKAEKRLDLFIDLDQDWKLAAQMIIAWLGFDRNSADAQALRDEVAANLPSIDALQLLRDRLDAALSHQSEFPFEELNPLGLEVGRELVKRVSGQDFDREMLGTINPSFITTLDQQSEMLDQVKRGYASNADAPVLVQMARAYGDDGSDLVDSYIDAHAGYNYIEYRNRSLWMVLHGVLRNHPKQEWVKERLRRLLIAVLSGGAVDFEEMLPMTAAFLAENAVHGDPVALLNKWAKNAIERVQKLKVSRDHNDSWGNHKRRLTALMELYHLLDLDSNAVADLRNKIAALPLGFAGFQAPANLRLAEARLVCGQTEDIDHTLEKSFRSAHNIQDYHFCARVTARCNALQTWHQKALNGQNLVETIERFVATPSAPEFAAEHLVHEPYEFRSDDSDTLPIGNAREAQTLENLVEVFQRPAVEFRRLNPKFGLTDILPNEKILVPDPGLAPLLAVHFAAAVLADKNLLAERHSLIRSLIPNAVNNPTALDTVLSYLLIAQSPDSISILKEITTEIGPVVSRDVDRPLEQIGPDSPMPT